MRSITDPSVSVPLTVLRYLLLGPHVDRMHEIATLITILGRRNRIPRGGPVPAGEEPRPLRRAKQNSSGPVENRP
ncbi:hypothetical protein [Nocardia sp. NPDC052112]|uniref:hypothetical protein n=1 Tax=Nocardia sp. NPDC052112 TaxID=3155646 RepID=UPI003440C81B